METDKKFALVKSPDNQSLIKIAVSADKPQIPGTIEEKWEKIVNLIANLLHVPSTLITHFNEELLEIFAASETVGNPYKKNDNDKLGIGMFCEQVASSGKKLIVQDTEQTDYWKNNPHAGLGMKSYCGVPIFWDDGELFGTLCMLSDKKNIISPESIELIELFSQIIEKDLSHLRENEQLEKNLDLARLRLREIHHRIKNQFAILFSYINLKANRKDIYDISTILLEIQHRILALSMIHEILSQTDSKTSRSLDQFIPKLCGLIIKDFACSHIETQYDIEPIRLEMDAETSLTLIISELLTNSLKHAFEPEASPKKISLTCRMIDTGKMEMTFKDNGKGLPPGFDVQNLNSTGMMLISALTLQLNGKFNALTENGTTFNFEFPVKTGA